MTPPPAPRRRADARRSRAAILEAAARVLDGDPDARLEAVAAAAGVTRQTVYAHFPSRERLLAGVADQLTQQAVAAMDAAEPDAGPAADALLRVLDASAEPLSRFPALVRRISALPVGPGADRERHAPVAERLARVVRRGRRAGEFDDRPPVDWLVTVVIGLAHAASEERDAGRMTGAQAREALRTSVLRVLGASAPGSARAEQDRTP
ncbi:TetR/AcrR family transcriptional regulator [Streptomyces boncukensis]|uniref:TetR/AcrR family transcriptional regulator n=1 Tax=Streptomyces boncukensis TaxID=2711219 RepID=A0A6G4WXY0_9ACTN|nr:TetR/AcrR family transcriptional regulator [Streptomyces boncukensis]NGO70146.1 TetR/AcrR family transcriptional regulator [Streptomyces boncukensis]